LVARCANRFQPYGFQSPFNFSVFADTMFGYLLISACRSPPPLSRQAEPTTSGRIPQR